MKGYEVYAELWHMFMILQAIFISIPSRLVANGWRYVYDITVPRFLRVPLYKWWAWHYGANLDEAEKPITEYRSLLELFTRKISAPRPVDNVDMGISQQKEEEEARKAEEEEPGGEGFEMEETQAPPTDKYAAKMGAKQRNNLVYVKGIPYRIQDLLGVPPPEPREGNKLHLYTLFLPANEYHHFHSPVDWTVTHRLRLPGHVLPLLPEKTRKYPHMMWSNERVSLLGRWKHGFFGFVAIAATAFVGRIKMVKEPELRTNQIYGIFESFQYITGHSPPHAKLRRSNHPYGLPQPGVEPVAGEEGATPSQGLHVKHLKAPWKFNKGDEIGWFEVGSGICLIFEAPKDWKLQHMAMAPGRKFQLGNALSVV